MLKSSNVSSIAAVVALVMFGFVSQVEAQRGRGGRDQSNELSLLGNEQVQEELELVDDQIEEIKELSNEIRSSMREMINSRREEMQGASGEEQREMWREVQEDMKKEYADFKPKVEAVLLPAQVKRLAEIKMQATLRRSGGLTSERGGQALKDQLELTDEQIAAMKEKAVKIRESLAAKYAKLRKEAENEILSVLEPEQREKYKELMGETYDVDGLFQRGGRGGRGGRVVAADVTVVGADVTVVAADAMVVAAGAMVVAAGVMVVTAVAIAVGTLTKLTKCGNRQVELLPL